METFPPSQLLPRGAGPVPILLSVFTFLFLIVVVIVFEIYSLNFQVCSTVLLIIVTMVYTRTPELIHLTVGYFYPTPQPLATTVLLLLHHSISMSSAFLDSTYK